ncbi:hypothetical protein, partial [Rhodoferax sp.]|uniref:hypothetical protein n=1 Tax=Rhodoferax sp. TaxID=50421 RepID=UPI0025EC7E53
KIAWISTYPTVQICRTTSIRRFDESREVLRSDGILPRFANAWDITAEVSERLNKKRPRRVFSN